MDDSTPPATDRDPPITEGPLLAPFTRRRFLRVVAIGGSAIVLAACAPIDAPAPAEPPPTTVPTSATVMSDTAPAITTIGPEPAALTLQINGTPYLLDLPPQTTLLDALRERIGLTGTKKACNQGACGACTVLVDGRRINSCMALAVQYVDMEITTIEGLAQGDQLHPVQQAFIDHDAFQCGFCTSGQVVSAIALLQEGRATSDDEIREWMSGNICRCAAYPNIVAAIRDVAAQGGA
jgi:xanthine dehydrogenase YagT iron-sulfur-binding subunit